MEKQGTADATKAAKEPASGKKGVKHANNDEETPSKKPKKIAKQGAQVKEEDEDNGERN
jgi:hypothetical protein